MKLASIIGRVFRFDHLHGYYPEQRPKDFLYADLSILAKLDLTPLDEHEPELTYLFRHIITHEVIYETLPASTRVALHELFAQFLEQLTGDDVSPYLDVLAYHYERSENLSKKLTYLRQAAEAAAAHFFNDSAIRYYQRAITILQNTGQKERDPALYTDLSERMAEILHLVTRYDEARFAYLNALKYVPDNQPTRRAQLTFKIGNTWREQHDFSGALEAYSQALQILGDPPHANGLMSGGTQESEIAAWQCWIQVHLEMLSAYYWLILVDQSEDLCQKLMPVVDRYGTPVQRSSLLQALAALSIRRARYYHPIDAVNYYYAALVEYQKVGLSEKIPAVRFQYGLALLYTDELHLAEIELGYALQLAEQRGDLSLKSRCLTYVTMLYRKKGQVEKVEEFAEYSESIATAAHMPEYSGAAMANRAWIAWRRNDLQATRKHARDALSQWDAAGVQTLATPYYWTAVWPLISVELRENQLSRAVELARSLLEPSRARMPDELTKTLEEACAAWDAEQSEVARELLQKATAQAEKFMYL